MLVRLLWKFQQFVITCIALGLKLSETLQMQRFTSMIMKVLLATHVLLLTSGHLHCSNDSWEVGFSFRLELVTRTFQLRSINVETFREFFNSIQLRKIITISCMLDNPPQMFVFLYWTVGWGTQKVRKLRTLMATSKHYTCTLYWG